MYVVGWRENRPPSVGVPNGFEGYE